MAARKSIPPVNQRLWSRVVKGNPDDCWIWTGQTDDWGYGVLRMVKKDKAHRVAWRLTFGEIPPGLSVLHRCDNPPCVNPSHLWLGTAKDNARDREAKKRHVPARGESCGASKLTENAVFAIRACRASHAALGRFFGVTADTIMKIRQRKHWRHI